MLEPEQDLPGCTGGGDFYMASKYGVFVHGIDLSVNMVTTALERAAADAAAAKVGRLFCPFVHCLCGPSGKSINWFTAYCSILGA